MPNRIRFMFFRPERRCGKLRPIARPLLVLHGTNDRNVSFADSLRLFDVLIKLGKSFESQIYPGEIHFFRRDIVLRDAWKRAEEFFERTVKNGQPMTSSSSSTRQ